ncbi:MAG: DUF63 family protein, partial [Candidatus ainarchaeum sp.]|nr:DUF63 family protein [Candidatus ainarchaeum sp.]
MDQYYVQPIVGHEGYNSVNTLTYALIAIAAVFLAYRFFQQNKIRMDMEFVLNTLPFVLFGSTVRVVTDSIDTGVMKPANALYSFILNSHIYDYGFLTSSPGIYIVTAALFFISLAIGVWLKDRKITGYIGLVLWVPHMPVLIPMVSYPLFAIPVLVLAAIPALLAWKYFKSGLLAGVVGAHALDGAATFFVIDYFGKITGRNYFEQHVIPSFIGQTFGSFFPFYLLKIAIAGGA